MVECVLCVLCGCKDFLKIDKVYPRTRYLKLRTNLLYIMRGTLSSSEVVLTERQHITLGQQKVGMTDRGAIRLVNVRWPALNLESSLK